MTQSHRVIVFYLNLLKPVLGANGTRSTGIRMTFRNMRIGGKGERGKGVKGKDGSD